jgi:putative serine protease PepD
LAGGGRFTVEAMETYEDPNQAPTDAAGERAMGHDVPVGPAAVPPASEPTTPMPAAGEPLADAPASRPPASWASTYRSATTEPAGDAHRSDDVPDRGWPPAPGIGPAADRSPAGHGSTPGPSAAPGESSAPAYGSAPAHRPGWDDSAAVNRAEPLPHPAGFLPPAAMASGGGAGATMAAPAHARRTGGSGRRLAMAGVAAIVLAAGGGFAGAAGMHAFNHTSASSVTAATSVQTVAGANSIANVVSAVDQEVVSITVRGQQQADEGSGVVVSSDGLILTNNHVIAAAAGGGSVQVTFTNGKTVSATIVKADPQEDLALVQAQGVSGLKAATFGDSNNLQIGDTVIAIGNELGLSNSVSAGIVSALHRQVTVGGEGGGSQSVTQSSATTYGDAIQTDASTNQGDSGGALFNMAGQVVGINSAIATGSSGSTGSVGIGFAISSNDAQKFVGSAVSS